MGDRAVHESNLVDWRSLVCRHVLEHRWAKPLHGVRV